MLRVCACVMLQHQPLPALYLYRSGRDYGQRQFGPVYLSDIMIHVDLTKGTRFLKPSLADIFHKSSG